MSEVAYIGETIPIPHAHALSPEHNRIGSGSRTALGKYRYDAIGIEESYKLEARNLSFSEYEDIKDHIYDNLGITTFWLDEFGGDPETDSIEAHVYITKDERIQFSRDGSWENKGREIELEIIPIS